MHAQKDFERMVSAQEGFKYRAEKPEAAEFVEQKWGWTSDQPGTSELHHQLPSLHPLQPVAQLWESPRVGWGQGSRRLPAARGVGG